MKIYFQNRTAKLQHGIEGYSCKRCPFDNVYTRCPFGEAVIVDCYNKGWWVDGESSEIFKL
mgnify:CR=1 FL=1